MTEDHDHLGSIDSFDPVNINVMTSLNPEYVSDIQDAVNSGLDENFRGIFTYVSDNDDDNQDNENDVTIANIIRNLPPPGS